WQQIAGTLALLPFLAFAAALSRWARLDGRRNRWLMPAAGLVALATVATTLVPLAMALMADLSPDLAHQLTVVEDLADSVLFASLAGFVLATSTGAPVWVRALAVLVAIASLARAVLSPFGVYVLDFAALLAVFFGSAGLVDGVSAVTVAYAELGFAVPGSLPAVSLINAVSGVTFLVGFFLPTSVGLLMFPDGRLPSVRWRLAIYASAAGLALQVIGLLIGDGTAAGFALETAGIAATVAGALAAVASLLFRWRK